MEDRRYTNKEFKQIMDRALRLQGRGDANAEQGHSMNELIAIGRDLGIDEHAVREAANDVALRESGTMSARLAGGELVQREQVEVPHEMSREATEEVAAQIRHVVGLPGSDSVVGRRITWQTDYLLAQQRAWTLSVSVSAHEGRTRVEVEGRNGMLAGGLFGGIAGGVGIGAGVGVGVGVGLGALGSPLFAVVVPIASITVAYLGSRSLFRVITRSRRQRIARMAEEIANLVRAGADRDDSPPGDD